MQRNISVDVLKLILSFFVIGLHCSFFKDIDKDVAHMLNQGLFRIGVPLFLLINGYFFFRVQTSAQFKKWCRRLLKLYVFWMIAYLPIWGSKLQPLSIITVFNGYFHLWYIINLLYAAILFWYLRKYSGQLQYLTVSALFLTGLGLQYIGNYIITDDSTFIGNLLDFTPLYRNFLFLCLPMFFIGYKMHQHEMKFPKWALPVAIALFIAEAWLNMRFADYEGFDILLALVVFCPILFDKIRRIDIPSSNKHISLVSSAVFLIHPLILHVLMLNGIKGPTPLTIYTILLSLALAFPLILLNKKLKFIL